MARKIKDLAVKIGSYADQSGQTKGRYQNVGALMQNDDGSQYLLIERWFNPAGVINPDGRGNLLVSMFDLRDRQGDQGAPPPAQSGKGYDYHPASQSSAPPARNPMDDEIPF